MSKGKKRQSKSWYVKIKGEDEREVRVTGFTTAEGAMASVTPGEGEEVVSARPVRVYKDPAPKETPTQTETGQ